MKEEPTESQAKEMLKHMLRGGTITSLSAFSMFDCVKCSNRISELRQLGYPIHGEWLRLDNGKRIVRYSIPPQFRKVECRQKELELC